VAEELERHIGVKAGATSADGEFTLETQNCLGGCALGPIVVVDGHYFGNVGVAKVSEILAKAREDLDKIDIQSDRRVFPVDVSCSRCNHTLMDPSQRVDGHPGIRVTISFGDKHGWLLLSSLYGSYDIVSEHEIPEGVAADFFCPHCHAEMTGAAPCVECGAAMVPMIVRGGGVVQICSRHGCHNHRLDLDGVNV
jgi:(2Fe-2S) ferredoxin